MQKTFASRGRYKDKRKAVRKATGLSGNDKRYTNAWVLRRICLGTNLKYLLFQMKETRYFPTGPGLLRQSRDGNIRNN